MKTLLFSPGFPPSIGGMQSFMARRAAALEDVSIIASTCEGDEEFDAKSDFTIRRFRYSWHSPRSPFLRRPIQLWRSRAILKQVLASDRFDVLEMVSVFPGAIAALSLGIVPRVLVSYAMGDDVLRPASTLGVSWIYRRVLQRIPLFVAISEYTKSLLVEQAVPSERIVIVHPPIEHDVFSEKQEGKRIRSSFREHDLLLLTVTRLVPKKGIDKVLRHLPRWLKRFPGLLYVIGGDGPDRMRLERLARDLRITKNVHFLGRVPDEDLQSLYAAADLFIMLTRADRKSADVEGYGIVFREAGSQETPAVGPRIGGAPDAIHHEATGLLVDVENDEEISNAVTRFLSDPEMLRNFGEAARRLALEPPGWNKLDVRIQELLEKKSR